MEVAIITFIVCLLFGLVLVLRSGPDAKSSRGLLIVGLILLGLGGFGLLDLWLEGWLAALITAIVMVALPAGTTRSLTGTMYGVGAVLITALVGVILSLAARGDWLVQATAALTDSSSTFGKLVTDWIGSWGG